MISIKSRHRFSYCYIALKPLENVIRFVISVFLMTNLRLNENSDNPVTEIMNSFLEGIKKHSSYTELSDDITHA